MLVKHIVKQGLLLRNVGAISRAAYHDGTHEPVKMNDMPVPEGDWYEEQAKKNSKYNAYLIVGILSLAGTIGLAKSTGLIQLNYSPPQSID